MTRKPSSRDRKKKFRRSKPAVKVIEEPTEEKGKRKKRRERKPPESLKNT